MLIMRVNKTKRSLPSRAIRKVKRQFALIPPRVMQLKYALPEVSLDSIATAEISHVSPIQDDRSIPPSGGNAQHDDLTPLLRIIKSLNPRVVLEIGTGYGNMTANICNQFTDLMVYTVNPPAEAQSGKLVTFTLTKEQIGRVYRAHGFGDRVTQIYKNSKDLDLSHYFTDPIIDLAVIDGCHDTDYVLNDFYKALPFVRSKGIILLHDTHPSLKKHLADTYLACMLLRKKGFDVVHIQGTWWGMWVKPDELTVATKDGTGSAN